MPRLSVPNRCEPRSRRGANRKIHQRLLGRLGALAALTGMALLAGPVRAQNVLDQVPSDAMMVIKIHNLQEVSQKAGALAQQIGIANFAPMAADPLGSALKELKVNAGLNKAGDLAIVAVKNSAAKPEGDAPAEGAGNTDEPKPLVLIPVTDYQAFLGNFADVQTEGGISTFTASGHRDQKVYSAQWGSFAAVSPVKEVLANKPAGLKVQGVCAKELEARDITFYANVAAIAPDALDAIRKNREQWLGMLEKAMQAQGGAAGQDQFVKILVDRYLAGAERFLEDAQGATFSVNLTKDGIGTSMVGEFKAGSYTAKLAQSFKTAAPPPLNGLPEAKYLVYGGMQINGPAMAKWMDDVVTPTLPALQKAGADGKAVQDWLDSIKSILQATQSETFGMVTPTGNIGQAPLFQVIAVLRGDAKAIASGDRKIMESQDAVMKGLGNAPSTKTELTPKAKTIDGVDFDKFTVKFEAGNTPEGMQVQNMIQVMYGPEGMVGLIGQVDEKNVIYAAGVDDATLTATIASVKANTDALSKSEGVQMVSKNLPQNSSSIVYIDMGNMVAAVVDYSKQMNFPLPIQMQPNLPPIGISGSTDENAVRFDTFVPADLIQSMVAAGMQAFMAANQGGGGGGPGGL